MNVTKMSGFIRLLGNHRILNRTFTEISVYFYDSITMKNIVMGTVLVASPKEIENKPIGFPVFCFPEFEIPIAVEMHTCSVQLVTVFVQKNEKGNLHTYM